MQPQQTSEKNLWNEFIARHSSPSSFLQSWEWGQFQASLGQRVHRLKLTDMMQVQAIVKKMPLGRVYLELPKGPVCLESKIRSRELWRDFSAQLREIGRQEKAVLARINPPYELVPDLVEAGFRPPEILLRQREPERTILVDLARSEDELLENMHEKSRYNIRLAQRKGVVVRLATADKGAFETFLRLLGETTKRDSIVSWPRERFWKFREVFMTSSPNQETPHAELLVGEYKGEILAAAIVMLFGDSGTYLYAASSAQERSANAPSLVLWEAIKLTKRVGKKWYDMWGVAPNDSPEHSWAGITRFKSRYVKLGVTGKDLIPPGTRDLVLNKPFYSFFKFAKRFRP
jgi:peptidoglycan pentaglycine glycine transferase (the first glycine)